MRTPTLRVPDPASESDDRAPRRTSRVGRWIVGALAALAGIVALSGLAVLLRWGPFAPPPPWHGGAIDPAHDVGTLTLQRADGGAFRETDLIGRTTLFFFGYTRCPDVCPLALAHAAQVVRDLGIDGAGLDVYFVTVDPDRDGPERLRAYTANFGPRIVGLTGTPDQLAAAYRAFGVVSAKRPIEGRPDDYSVDHSAYVYLLDQSARVRLIYGYDQDPADLVADVRRLAREQLLRVADGWTRAVDRGMTAGGFLTIENRGTADRLIAARSDASERVEIHRTTVENGVARMEPIPALPIPYGATRLEPGGLHLMLVGTRRPFQIDERIVVMLTFENAGDLPAVLGVRSAVAATPMSGMGR